MKAIDLKSWVEKTDKSHKRLHQAMHIVISAIANHPGLNSEMVMKGGTLLSIRYKNFRYTKDIDFSTDIERAQFDKNNFIRELNKSLALHCEKLPYDLFCRVQKTEFKPKNELATFPTLRINIGYAVKNTRHHRNLQKGGTAPNVVPIDYSFNESTHEVEYIQLADGGKFPAYSFEDLIAEKYRAVLQQEERNRFRNQDVFDLHFLISNFEIKSPGKQKILDFLIRKCASRNLEIRKDEMSKDEIKERAKKRYPEIKNQIEGELPDFDMIYLIVREFYESLPWE